MTALRNLLAAVEAGKIAPSDLDAFIPVFGLNAQTNDALDAYRGGLDAAQRLHDAVLPGWKWTVCDVEASVYGAAPDDYFGAFSPTPARAWLIAILMALVAMEGK